jgi:hypothetical protein
MIKKGVTIIEIKGELKGELKKGVKSDKCFVAYKVGSIFCHLRCHPFFSRLRREIEQIENKIFK